MPKPKKPKPIIPQHSPKKGAKELSRADWEQVLTLHEYTGKPGELAARSKLHIDDVKYLINKGLPRLGLHPIKDHIVDRSQVELAMQEQRQRSAETYGPAVQAATERACSEAAAAQDLLSNAITTGVIVGQYAEQLAKGLARNKIKLAVPDEVTPALLETLAKVADANSRAVERAVKLVRLTKGMPTDRVDNRVVALLSECSLDELRAAAITGGLPKRLVSRSNAADPIEDGGRKVGINTKSDIIDVEFEEGKEPSWLTAIAPAEGESTEDT